MVVHIFIVEKLTHFFVGLATALYGGFDPIPVVLGALLPDLDYYCCHRKMLHNIFVLALSSFFSIGLMVGIATHMLLDALTQYGIAILYPFSSQRYVIAKFRTGGIFDKIIGATALFLVLAYLGTHYVPQQAIDLLCRLVSRVGLACVPPV